MNYQFYCRASKATKNGLALHEFSFFAMFLYITNKYFSRILLRQSAKLHNNHT